MNSSYLYKFVVTVLICLGLLCLALVLFSCNAYKEVAKNGNPSEKERSLLAIACAREFPVIQNTYNIDSVIKSTQKDYTHQIDSLANLTEKLDSIIHEQLPVIDTLFIDSSDCIPRFKIAINQIQKLNNQRSLLQASVNHLKNQLFNLRKEYKPCDSVIKSTFVIAQCDSARMKILADQTRLYKDSTLVMSTKYKDARKTSKNRLFWVIGLIAALVGLIVLYVKRKK